MKKILLLLMITATSLCAWAQDSYIPYKAYDGEHKHEASAYVMGGDNVVSGKFGGLAVSYNHHFPPR